jgi:hypothetical protein
MSLQAEPESPDAVVGSRIQTALRKRKRDLYLARLQLTSLPESLGQLTKLEKLKQMLLKKTSKHGMI